MVIRILVRYPVSPCTLGKGTVWNDGVSSLVLEYVSTIGSINTNEYMRYVPRPFYKCCLDGPESSIFHREGRSLHKCHIFVLYVTQNTRFIY